MKLSAQAARDLQPGQQLRDHEVDGLVLRARAHVKVWSLRYTIHGQERRYRIGTFPTIGIEPARKLAKDAHTRISRGEDPSAERQELRAAPTCNDLFAIWQTHHAARKNSASYKAANEGYWNNYLKAVLGTLKVRDVRTIDVNRALDKVPGRVAPNRARSFLHKMFEIAEHNDYKMRPKHTNPTADIDRRPEQRRKRKMELREFEEISRRMDDFEPRYPRQVAAMRVVILAGTRITEVMGAKKSDLQGDKLIRAEHKTARSTGEDREIFLPTQALEVIDNMPDDASPYIFGAGLMSGRGRHAKKRSPHLTRHNVFDVWALIRADVPGATDLRLQDLRRTFASIAGSIGIGLDGVGQLFGHKHPSTTRRYQWLYENVASANAQATADAIMRKMRPSPPSPAE